MKASSEITEAKGGIIIPDTTRKAAGRRGRRRWFWCARRSRQAHSHRSQGGRSGVLLGKWSGTEAKIDGEELLIVKESDVMGVLEGANASRKVA